MTCDQYEICLLDVLDPIQKQFPQCVDTFCDEAFSFKRNLLNLGSVPTRFCPVLDGCGCSVCESDRGACWLSENFLDDWSGEEAMDANGNGFLDSRRCWIDMQVRHGIFTTKEISPNLLPKVRLLD